MQDKRNDEKIHSSPGIEKKLKNMCLPIQTRIRWYLIKLRQYDLIIGQQRIKMIRDTKKENFPDFRTSFQSNFYVFQSDI